MFNNIFRGLFGTEVSPTMVIEVKSDNYVSRPVRYREESIFLYGPNPKATDRNSSEKNFEIVLHKPFTESWQQMYSLFRTQNQDVAEERFITYKDRIPTYINLTKECTPASLQRICDVLTEHQAWTMAHIAAHFKLVTLFNNSDVQRHINDIDVHTGMTPIMVAITTGDVKLVQSLISLKCSLSITDLEGNNVFHYAAKTSKEIVQAFVKDENRGALNTYNKLGYTPLHVACLSNSPECVKALLLAGADVNLSARPDVNATHYSSPGYVSELVQGNSNKFFMKDVKHGGTPLHWAISREIIDLLIEKNCNKDAVNFEGKTALHMMVLRDRLECVMALLSQGADHSIPDSEGNTPLHIAVQQTNLSIVQALIVFGANLEAKNLSRFTPRHLVPVQMTSSNSDKILYLLHAVGAQRCPPDYQGCSHSCSASGEYCGVPPPLIERSPSREVINQMLTVASMERASNLDPSQKTGRLLCLDGGGIRGLVLIQILLELEKLAGQPIIHCFDWVGGTSTGGIIALALAAGKTLRECQSLYFRMKERVFVGMRPYSSERLDDILKQCLGTETVMADIEHPKLMILALLADRKPVDLHIFRNYTSPKEILDSHNGFDSFGGKRYAEMSADGDATSVCSLPPPPGPAEQPLWQVARATGAAPTYFRAFDRYLDGGLIGNNPTLDALTELTELRLALRATGDYEQASKTDLKLVVSCGTGLNPTTPLKDIDVFRPESLWDAARLAWGISALGTLVVDQATQSDGRVVDRARAWCSIAGVPYYRFNPPLSKDIPMDERQDDVLVNMLWEAKSYMYQQRHRAKDVCAVLLSN